ncbi:MAG: TauD/TfdA family dioxygenase [Hyphomicrobiales bacterium]|nr:TauD/TfdA family dioxygenase [Hyphomicrobiales bacterium]
MPLSVRKIGKTFVGEVSGVDLSEPLNAATIDDIRQAWWDHSILVFREQEIDDAQHLAFSRHFGELQGHTVKDWLSRVHLEILVLSNRGRGGVKPLDNGGAYWHSDITYEAVPPMGSILHGLTVPPEGGDTLYADMYAAYETLDDETRELIDGRTATHNYRHRYMKMAQGGKRPTPTAEQLAEWQDVEHPVVLAHPDSGRKALFVNEGFTVAINGLERAESDALLNRLNEHSVQPNFVYAHNWHPDDIVMWDNRCTMHRATEYDVERYERTMHRTTIKGTASRQAAAA